MEETIRNLFLQINNPNTTVRNNAEQQLKLIEKNPDALSIIQNKLMTDGDLMVRQSASIYFSNKVIENYKAPELAQFISNLELNILNYLTVPEKSVNQAYSKILVCFYNKSEIEEVQKFVSKIMPIIETQNDVELKAVLQAIFKIFEAEELRFNLNKILEIIFDQNGSVFGRRFSESLQANKYEISKLFMQITTKSYLHYSLPAYLNEVETFKIYFKLALDIFTTTPDVEPEAKLLKKVAIFFLYKCAYKGIKSHFSNSKFTTFIRNAETLNILVSIFNSIITDFSNNKIIHNSVPIYAAQFFDVCSSVAGTKSIVKENFNFLLYSFIIPVYKYDSDLEGMFEYNQEEYLRERYNYVTNELRSSVESLFVEMVQSNKEVGSQIIDCLIQNLLSDSIDIKIKYGIIGLLGDVQKDMEKTLGEEKYYNFIQTQIFPLLNSKDTFMISQALYFMGLSEEIKMGDDSTFAAMKRVYELINSESEAIQVEACLAMNFFFYNEKMNENLNSVVSGLLQKVLIFAKQYFLEALNSLMDSIIGIFTNTIALHAPEFVGSICDNIMILLNESDSQETSMNVAGYMGTIDKLIMAANAKPEIVEKIYLSANKVIYTIFKESKFDCFEEAFDLMNTFLYAMEKVDATAFEIFKVALNSEKDELVMYPREVSDFIDNYLSFGGENMINNETLLLMYNSVVLFLGEDEDIYEEDIAGSCKIIETLMLNCGKKVNNENPEFIPHVVKKIAEKYTVIEECASDSAVLALEAIMNAFIIAPEAVLGSLGSFFQTFFDSVWANSCYYKRVHDKKLFILFIGTLFKFNLNLDFSKLNTSFVTIFSSLPEAIKKRNQLIEDENLSEMDGDSDELGSYVEELQEDIYYSTPLDKFDAFKYTNEILSSLIPDSVGQKAVSSMSQSQIQIIQEILSTKQPEQKKLN